MTPAQHLLRAIQRAGISQAEAARCLGLRPQQLNSWTSGRKIPRADAYLRALNILRALPRRRSKSA